MALSPEASPKFSSVLRRASVHPAGDPGQLVGAASALGLTRMPPRDRGRAGLACRRAAPNSGAHRGRPVHGLRCRAEATRLSSGHQWARRLLLGSAQRSQGF